MKSHSLLIAFFVLIVSFATASGAEIPRLQKSANGVQLIVDGKPFVMLAGELHNSSTGSAHYMAPIWKRLHEQNLNTVIAAVSWELIEPEEGQFDFSLVDSMIAGASREDLKLVLLWFGSWKNGLSTYVPAWVKKNKKRFPLAQFDGGEEYNTLSTLGQATMEADAKAFGELMKHLRDHDTNRTVLMVQLENEMGTLDMMASYMGARNRAMRDYSLAANKAFEGQVPAALTGYLKQHAKDLHPAIAEAWKANGQKQAGTWEEVFGKGTQAKQIDSKDLSTDNSWQTDYPYLTEEIFNAWNYATYVERLASTAKAIYPLPLYVNTWIKQRSGREPGNYPSGGPQPHVFDIWRAAAPHVDILAPDIYAMDIFDWTCSGYNRDGNPLFIPETAATPDGAARAFYTFGKYYTLCYSPFGIDGNGLMLNPVDGDNSYTKAYEMLGHLMPYITQYSGTDRIGGLLIDGDSRKSDGLKMGKYLIGIRPFSTSSSQAMMGVSTGGQALQQQNVGGLIIFQTGDDEFIVAGGVGSLVATFTKSGDSKAAHVGLLSVDEITWDADGHTLYHRLNGDETAFGGAVVRQGEVKAFRVRMYEY